MNLKTYNHEKKKKKKKNTFLLRTSIFQENATHSYNQSARFIYFFFHEIFVNFSIFFFFPYLVLFFGLNMDKLKKNQIQKQKKKQTNKFYNICKF